MKLRNERGIALLYFSAVILPVMLVLFSVTIDIAMYLTEERQAQIILDKAGVHSQRFLPYAEDAEQAFHAFVDRHQQLNSGEVSFQYDPTTQGDDVISLRYAREFRPFFAGYFGGDISFPLRVRSDIRSTPLDAMLVVDTSSYMAPRIDADNPWSDFDGSTETPAWVFGQGLITFQHDLDNDGIPEAVHQGVASQQCFSPPLRNMKRAAIELYQYLGSFRDNAIGVSIYPSRVGDGYLTELTPVASTLKPGEVGDRSFSSFPMPFVRNEHCAAAAEREGGVWEYQFPTSPEHFSGLWKKEDGSPLYMIDQPSGWSFDDDYQPYLSTEEIIWSQAVSSHLSLPPNTVGVLDEIAAQLLSQEVVAARGGVQHAPLKQAFILAGDLPWVNGERLARSDGSINANVEDQLLTSLERIATVIAPYSDLHFRLYYLAFEHEGNRDGFTAGMTYFESILESFQSQLPEEVAERLSIQALWSADPIAVKEQVVSFLALSRKTGVVSR